MSNYVLLGPGYGQTGNVGVLPGIKPHGPENPNSPPQQQSFQLVVTGTDSVSATVQVYVTNDSNGDPSLDNWIAYGDPVTAAGTNIGMASWSGSQPFRRFTAALTALSGTSSAVKLAMSA